MNAVVNSVPAVDLGRKYLDLAYQYADDIRDEIIPACKWVKLAVKRWFYDLETGDGRGLYFDENAAARVFRFSGYCRQYEGEFAGLPLELQGWQCFIIANVFGWMRADGTRRFRIVYEKVARKNGKTTKLGFIASYGLLADNEGGPRVYSAATKRDQAKELYDAAEAMIAQSPKLSKLVRPYSDRLVAKASRGRMQALSKDSKSMDGLNVHYGLIDELHAHPNSAVWDVIKSARGARKQPLIWTITTEGFFVDGVDADQQAYAEKVLEGFDAGFEDDSYFAIIYTLDDPEAWDREGEWIKANPNWGVSVNPDDMREQCRMAKEIPTERIEFLTKRLNVKVRGEAKWMNLERFKLCEVDYDDQAPWNGNDEFRGADAWGGLDLSAVEDITSATFTINHKGKTRTFVRAYLPQGALDRRLEKGDKSLEKYIQTGHLQLTPGETVDYEFMKQDLRQALSYFNVAAIAFDRWNSVQLVNDMLAEGAPMIEFGQGFGSMSAPMKELMVRVLNQDFEYSNLLLYWCVANLVTESNPAGDIKPDKSRVKEKIDAAVSTIMALGMMILMPVKKRARSIYADGEI